MAKLIKKGNYAGDTIQCSVDGCSNDAVAVVRVVGLNLSLCVECVVKRLTVYEENFERNSKTPFELMESKE